ncbi:helix-turn-helix domain-containing protein [Actinomadura scrupuli]|uniref:helix-turn-helix domain-containing protein n=1 Tax=Actinomadura scrupuli TaxID=559629 RepID=UPI003D964D64
MTEYAVTPIRQETGLLAEIAELLRPELPSLADEIVDEIRLSVPEFARPLQGNFAVGMRLGVEQGLRQFVEQIADPGAPQEYGVRVYRALGRGEYLEGRSLDALQAAYRIGARFAWRRFADVGKKAEIAPERMYVLAEAVFAYIEEVSAHSVQAYTELGSRAVGTLQRRRHRLLELLIADPAVAAPSSLHELASDAQWRLPPTAACVAVDEQWHTRHLVSPALSADVLMDLERPDPCLLIPDADGPGRLDMLRRALRDTDFAIGPTLPLKDAALSLRLARQALSLMRRGIIGSGGHLRCEDHLFTLLLLSNEDLLSLLSRRRLAEFDELSADQFDRLSETLLTWLTTGASLPDVAARLCVHPQTVRYRMRRLQEMFGDRLHDPAWRYEMSLALQARLLLLAERRADER